MKIPIVDVSLYDIQDAYKRIKDVAWRTPILPYSRNEEPKIYLKLECLQRTGSFKIRGAWNMMSRCTDEERALGFVTVSAGNHGQAVAWSARRLKSPCIVYVPEAAVERKLRSMEAMGAKIIKKPAVEIMESMTDDRMYKTGMMYVPPFGDKYVVAGQGTIGLEILEELPGVRSILVPVGGGGLAAGVATAVKSLQPKVDVYGVQSQGAAPLPASLKRGSPVVIDSINTIADGIATNRVFDFMFPILREMLNDCLVVSDDEIKGAMKHILTEVHAVVEPAGAASLAAALKYKKELAEPILCIISGGNGDPRLLAELISTIE